MARKEREIEQMEQSLVGNDEKEIQPVNDKLLDEMKVVEQHTEEGAITLTHLLDGDCRQAMGGDNTAVLVGWIQSRMRGRTIVKRI